MTHRFLHKIALICAVLLAIVWGAALLTRAQSAPPQASSPGALADGSTLLPSGWRLAPAGRHLMIGDLPLNVVQSPDSRYLIVTNNGLAKPSFSVVDVANWTVKNTMPLEHAWYGLAWHPNGTRLYVGGGAQNAVQEFSYADGVLTPARTFNLPAVTGQSFAGGLAVGPDGKLLYVTRVFAQTLSTIDLSSGQLVKTVSLTAEPYACVVSADGKRLYVSLWGGSAVSVFDAQSLTAVDHFDTGEHPSAMVFSADGKRLFIACGNSASVWVFSTVTGQAIEEISMTLFPDAPRTATPNALALAPDGKTLLVANADDNTVAVVDISNSTSSSVSGFIPTGWYPTGVLFARDGRQLFVLSGKGLAPSPNMANNGGDQRLRGAVTAVPTPDRTALAEHTRKVYSLTPHSDAIRLTPNVPIDRQSRTRASLRSARLHEPGNRNYDQVSAIWRRATAIRLVLFAATTPNAHARAEGFALFDNLRQCRRQRRSCVLDRRLRDRRHPEDLADALCKTWRAIPVSAEPCNPSNYGAGII